MKNQYVADIGDYGKYSLLKEFTDAGVRIGVNWYRTLDDESNDGKFRDYLEKEDMRNYCPDVFDALRVIEKRDRTISGVEKSGMLKDTVYFNELMDFQGKAPERKEERIKWSRRAEEKLADAELVFLDPDNGLLANDKSKRIKKEKYVLPDEILNLYEKHNVVYYCHKGRRKDDKWEEYKAHMLMSLPGAKPFVLTYHKGTQRSYVFLVHPKDAKRYRRIIDKFLEKWEGVFTEESASVTNT